MFISKDEYYQFLDYKEIKQRSRINQIAIDCADGERYFIDQVSINTRLREDLAELEKNDNITMLIHPNGGNIVELTHCGAELLNFEETMETLGKDAKSKYSFKNYDYRVCEDEKYTLKLEFTDENGEKFYLIDYQSAGKDWESDIAAWLPTASGSEK